MTAPAPIALAWARSCEAPLWVSVALFVAAAADPTTGTLTLKRGELRRKVDPITSKQAIYSAVARAIVAGWLAPGSTTTDLQLERPHR